MLNMFRDNRCGSHSSIGLEALVEQNSHVAVQEETMKPAGVVSKTKDNSKKKPYEREQWMRRKREGRAKQVFIDTRMGMSIEEVEKLSDAEILALPAPHWEKVSA